MSKGQREGTSPSQLVKVWLVGLNVDRAAYTVRKRDGLRVLLHYRNTAHQLLSRIDATSSSVLATFLYHVATHEITRQQLDSWFTTSSSAGITAPSLAQLVSRFETMSGLEKLIYTNSYNQHALLTDLLSRGMRVKLRDDIPDLSKRNKMLRPMRDGKVKVEAEVEQRSETEERKDGPRQGKEERRDEKKAKRDKPSQQLPQQAAAVLSAGEQKNDKDDSSDTEDDEEDEPDARPSNGSLDASSASTEMSTPPITPFTAYSYVIVWWSPQPQPSLSSPSSSHGRLQALMAGLMRVNSQVGVWEMSGEEVDVETVLTRLHVRILAALSAPVITASTPQQRIADILAHISSSQSAALTAPLPLRVEDACMVIVDRAYFERTVWPLIATPASVYELTEESPVIEYVDARLMAGVKAERGAEESKQSAALTPAQQKDEERTAALSRKLVNEHIRRLCAPSPFLIYHLTSALPSLIFPPTPNKPLWSIAAGVELTRPLVVEWPLHLPFDGAVIMLWCQWQLTVKQANSRSGEVLVIVPCRCWRRRGVRDMRAELAEADMRGRLYGRDRGGRDDRGGNVVELKGVAVSMRPSPLPMERRMLVSDDAHFFVLQLSIRPPSVAVNSAVFPPSAFLVPASAAAAVSSTMPAASPPPSEAAAATSVSAQLVVPVVPSVSQPSTSSTAAHAPVSLTPPPLSSTSPAHPSTSSSSSSSMHPARQLRRTFTPPPSHHPATRSSSQLSSPPPLQPDPLTTQLAHRTRSKTAAGSPANANGSGGKDGWVSVSGTDVPLIAPMGFNGHSVPPMTNSRMVSGGGGAGGAYGVGRTAGQRMNAASRMRGRSGSMGGGGVGSSMTNGAFQHYAQGRGRSG